MNSFLLSFWEYIKNTDEGLSLKLSENDANTSLNITQSEEVDAPEENDESLHDQITRYISNYDPYATPPDFNAAKQHQKASAVGHLAKWLEEHPDRTRNQFCPCCNLPYESENFSLCVPIEKLGELGSGFTLYYDLIKLLVIWWLICFILSVFNLYENNAADSIDGDYTDEYYELLRLSLASFGDSRGSAIQPWINNGIVIFLLWILFPIITLRHKKLVNLIDQDSVTPSDFTLMFKGLPQDLDVEDFKEFLEQKSLQDRKVSIVKINKAYKIDDYVAVRQQYQMLRHKIESTRNLQNSCCFSKAKLQQDLEDLEKQIEALEPQVTMAVRFVGIVFVTYNLENEAKASLLQFTGHYFERWIQILQRIFWRQKVARLYYKQKRFKVERAAEAKDVIWQNLGQRGKKRRRIFSASVIFFILMLWLCSIFVAATIKVSFQKNSYGSLETEPDRWFLAQFFLWFPAAHVVIINYISTLIISAFWKYEKYDTQTSYITGNAVKLTLFLFINSALIVFIVYFSDMNLLVSEAYNIVIANAIFSPLFQLITPQKIIKKIRKILVMKDAENSQMTQQQANNLFQGLPVDMARRNANIMKTLLLGMFYGPVLPLAYPVTALSLVAEYWVSKYCLLRLHRRPENLGHFLDKVILRIVKLGPLLLAISNFLFHANGSALNFIACTLGLWIAFVSIFTPFSRFLKKWLKIRTSSPIESIDDEKQAEKTYKDYQIEFFEDYDRENPISAKTATEKWIQLIRQKTGEEQADIAAYMSKEKLGDDIGQFLMQKGRRKSVIYRHHPRLEKLIEDGVQSEQNNLPSMMKLGSRYVRGIPRHNSNVDLDDQLIPGLHALVVSKLQ